MSREHNGVAGLALAPWEEPCTESDDTAADDRAALMALEDAGCVVVEHDGGEWRVSRWGVLLGGGGTQALAVTAAARALSVLGRRAA